MARVSGARRITMRVLLCAVAVCAVATPALGDDVLDKKAAVDRQIDELSSQLEAHRRSEEALRREIDAVTSRIRSLESNVGDVSLRLQTLEQDLALHRERLTKLNQLFKLQSTRLLLLKQQYKTAVKRLDRRLVAIYVAGQPSVLEFVVGASSLDEVLNKVDYMARIAREDRKIAEDVADSRDAMHKARARTKELRKRVAGAAAVITARAAQVRETRDALVSAKNSLAASNQQRFVALEDLTAQQREEAQEIDQLRASSAALAAQIRAAQAASGSAGRPASSAGLAWPVSAGITSPFGWRWGRMHEGIDLGAGYGAPIYASASGTVIACGYTGGYGNLVVIDHGGGLATAYGHQSSIAVGCGQSVSQGQVIGYVGSTGRSTGPHLHFEVRVNGGAVDPLGYL
jgi:murein DD-endopeptidase MepM/ murein hydrolase activator NlpD